MLVVPPGRVVEPGALAPPEPVVEGPPFRGLLVGNLIRCKGVLELLEGLRRHAAPADGLTLDILGRDDFEPDYARACPGARAG